jgi:hypothetical protein
MGRHPRDRVKMAVSTAMGSKPAITHYADLQRQAGRRPSGQPGAVPPGNRPYPPDPRAHESIGFPLVGDTVYGKQHLADYFPRQALQARRLGLVHPAHRRTVRVDGAAGDDFAELLARAGIEEPERSDALADPALAGLANNVGVLSTTRLGGVSPAPYDDGGAAASIWATTWRPAAQCGAQPRHLCAMLPSEPVWLSQVHGTAVANVADAGRRKRPRPTPACPRRRARSASS